MFYDIFLDIVHNAIELYGGAAPVTNSSCKLQTWSIKPVHVSRGNLEYKSYKILIYRLQIAESVSAFDQCF